MPTLAFTVRDVDVTIADGIPVEIGGFRVRSGPIRITLDDEAPVGSSYGGLDYEANVARALFRVRLDLPALSFALEAAGLSSDVAPVRGEIRCLGPILPDHSFAMHGSCRLAPHDLFRASALQARMLTGT